MVKIMYMGDSTPAGWKYVPGDPDGEYIVENEVKVLNDMLQAELGAANIEAINVAVGGTGVADWCNGGHTVPLSFAQRIAAFPDVTHFILQVGINNAYDPRWGTSDADRAAMIADWRWCLEGMYAKATAAGKKLILATPNPMNNIHNGILWELQNHMKAVAASHGQLVIDHWAAITASTPHWDRTLSDDKHPNDGLQKFKGTVAFMAIRGWL